MDTEETGKSAGIFVVALSRAAALVILLFVLVGGGDMLGIRIAAGIVAGVWLTALMAQSIRANLKDAKPVHNEPGEKQE